MLNKLSDAMICFYILVYNILSHIPGDVWPFLFDIMWPFWFDINVDCLLNSDTII